MMILLKTRKGLLFAADTESFRAGCKPLTNHFKSFDHV